MLHDIAGSVDEALVLGHEKDGAQVAGEAQGQDEGGDGPHPQAQHTSRSQHTCNSRHVILFIRLQHGQTLNVSFSLKLTC